jgi:hypothetical protein
VSWLIPCVLASISGLFSAVHGLMFPALFLRLPTTTFFNLLRSSVHHTTLASIIGVQKGFRQPSFKGAVGHDMTDIRHRKARAIPVFINSLVLAFLQFAAFIIRKTKAGREFKTATLKERHGTWINGYYYSLQHLCFFCFLRVQSFSYLAYRSRTSAADAFVAMVVERHLAGWLGMLGLVFDAS